MENQSPTLIQKNCSSHISDATKKASAAMGYFRDGCFDGSTSQSINRIIREFNECCAHFGILESGKAVYFVNAFEGPAHDFSFDKCPLRLTYNDILTITKREFDYSTRQLTVQTERQTLCLSIYMENHGFSSISDALEILLPEIDNLVLHGLASFWDDEHKIRYFICEMFEAPWANTAINQLSTMGFTFPNLCFWFEMDFNFQSNRAAHNHPFCFNVLFELHRKLYLHIENWTEQ